MTRFVVTGSPGDRRIDLFQAALNRLNLPAADVISYVDLLENRVDLRACLTPDMVLRIESPGKDADAYRAFLRLGADKAAVTQPRYLHLPAAELNMLTHEKGRILPPHQWAFGLERAMQMITNALPPHQKLMNHPAEIPVMFDKSECHGQLASHGFPVPRALIELTHYDYLIQEMEHLRMNRVFLKLQHGSSASGAVAYRFNDRQHQAITTVDMAGDKLFNTRRLRTLTDSREIARLINALCKYPVHVEEWIPKAGIAGKTFDLRVVVIAGKVQHIVVRQSTTPMTNLHLLNTRGDLDALRARMRPGAWAAAMATCEHLMATCFPDSLYAGIDLLITPDFRQHYVLEVNAFGDLLPNLLVDGKDTYTHEIEAVLKQ